MRVSSLTCFVAAIMLITLNPATPAKPDFSGAWKPDYSDLEIDDRAGMDCCSTLYRKLEIEQKGDRITIKESVLMARQDLTRESTYKTDGSDSINEGWSGREEVSQARWKEGRLVITSSIKVRNRTLETVTTLSLSEAGKTLTMLKEMINQRSRLSEKIVFHKAD